MNAAQLLKELQGAAGPLYVEGGVLRYANGRSVNLASVSSASDELATRKAKALDRVVAELAEAGFGRDDPINGGDCVDMVALIYQRLVKQFR
ncbi:MAG TPA: hypothetical protein VJ608_15355 [Albitalea sp.]|nr:hypothetical protein [Albitalea sp.]